MNRIPFPNPEEADDLNQMLDALTTGEQQRAENDIQRAALDFHALARAANPAHNPSGRPNVTQQGDSSMTTATWAASPPISNRTRRAQSTSATTTRPIPQWLYTAIAAVLLVVIVGAAWLNQPSGSPDNGIAWAPQNSALNSASLLNPESSPWMADFAAADCSAREYTPDGIAARYDAAQPMAQSYGITGPAAPADAEQVGDAYRDMRGCATLGQAWNYWSDARVAELPRDLTDANLSELTALQEHFAGVYPEQFMVGAEDVAVPEIVQTEWDARGELDMVGQPIPLGARINPEWGVELTDGRIAFPATLIYAANDPAIVANGLPIDAPISTVVMVFTFENNGWKYDDSLALCIENCVSGVGNPLDPAADPRGWTSGDATCDVAPLSAEDYRQLTIGMPEWQNREYEPIGPVTDDTAAAVVDTHRTMAQCSRTRKEAEARGLTTPLGLLNLTYGAPFVVTDEEKREYAVANAEESRQLALTLTPAPRFSIVTNVDGPEASSDPYPIALALDRLNISSSWAQYTYPVPVSATELSDGRVLILTSPGFDIHNRAAIAYEGELGTAKMVHNLADVYANVDGTWLFDEYVAIPLSIGQAKLQHPSILNLVYYEESEEDDATPEATPEN